MFEDPKTKRKEKLHLSDKQLSWATKFAKGAAIYSASCILFWAGADIVSAAALGLKAIGIGIPAYLGMSTLVSGGLMTVKSLVQHALFKFIYKKGEEEKIDRLREKGLPAPPPPQVSLLPDLKLAFNPAAILKRAGALLTRKPRPKPAQPGFT